MVLEITNTIQRIEKEHNVMEITYNGVPLWPTLRIYLADAIRGKITNVSSRGEASVSTFRVLFKSLFYFNPLKILKRYDIWLLDGAEDRKMFEDKAVLKTTGVISEQFEKTLIIESPFPKFHLNKKQIPDKNVISAAILYGFVFVFESWYKLISLKISNESILKQINKEHNLSFNYKSAFYRFWAQYRIMSLLVKITKKPKLVVINTPYTQMGYVLAFKQKNIKIVEFQHGVINENHPAYNSLHVNASYSPDVFFVFGDREKQLFEQENRCYVDPKHIYPVGSYILEKIKHTPTPDAFAEQRKQYSTIVVVAGEEPFYKNQIMTFLNTAAEINKNLFFAYIPRREKDYAQQHLKSANTGVFTGNIYEFIKAADIHATVHSTTCLEANYFGKATVFINLDNHSKLYYGSVFQSGACFADTPVEFVSLILAYQHEKVIPDFRFFADSNKMKVQELIQRYLV